MKVKYIGMVLLSSFIGIMLNPEFLTASDSVAIYDLERSNMVETVIVSMPEMKEVASAIDLASIETKITAPVAVSVEVDTAPAAPKAGSSVSVQNQVEFSWGRQNLLFANSTSVDAGTNVMKTGRLMWAHNNTAFNNIKGLNIGDIFAITIDGITEQYRVGVNPITQTSGVELVRKDDRTLFHESKGDIYVNALTDYGFGGHDLVLMTCAGKANSSRYVVVADKI